MKRGSVDTKKSELVALWIPHPLLIALDRAVEVEDSDRSKFIRRALRNHITQVGLQVSDSKTS